MKMERMNTLKRTVLRTKMLAAIVVVLFLLPGCNKRCHCYGYDGAHVYFTPEEVDAHEASNCSSMIYFADNRLYSLCEWDY